MALKVEPGYIGQTGYLHPVELDRNIMEALATGRSGLWRVGDFAVTPGAGSQQISIAAGRAILVGTENANQGGYFAYSEASESKSFGAPSGSTRYDTLLLRVKDDQYGTISGSPAAYWDTVAGVPGAGAARPNSDFNVGGSLYVPGAWFRIADIRINVGDTVIPAGQITHNLQYVRPNGGLAICTSVTRPTDMQVGDKIYETDTGLEYQYQGSTPGWIYQGNFRRSTTLSSTAASVTLGFPAGFRHLLVTWDARCNDNSASGIDMWMRINGDSTANYAHERMQGSGSGALTYPAPADTKFIIGIVATSASVAPGIFGNGTVDIVGLTSPYTSGAQASWKAGYMDAGTNGLTSVGGGRYSVNGPYTSVVLLPSLGSFVAGSIFTIHGVS